MLDIVRAGLLDAVPIVVEGLLFIANERQPRRFFSSGNAIRFGENTCRRSATDFKERGAQTYLLYVCHPDRTVSRVGEHPDFQKSAMDNIEWLEQKHRERRTFAGSRKQDDAAWLLDIRCDKALN